MPVDKAGRTYTIRKKMGKDGKMHKYPHYAAPSRGGGSKKASGSRGGGGGGKHNKPRRSFAVDLALAGGSLSVLGGLGVAQATIIQNKAMELAGLLGIGTGIGLVGIAFALKLASKDRVERFPVAGPIVHSVGLEWRDTVAAIGYRP